MTQLSVIPPNCLQPEYGGRAYQLLVPNQLKCIPHYTPRGDTFVILDNGVAEGHLLSYQEIDELDKQVCANEWVLPDVMGDVNDTLILVGKFAQHVDRAMGYMAVVQGKSLQEQMRMIETYAQYDFVTTLGFPRHLCGRDLRARLALTSVFEHEGYRERFQVHFLGMFPGYARELKMIPKWIRGVDSASPFYYAYAGARIEDDVQCKAQEGYFTNSFNDRQTELARENVATLEGWLNGRV